MAIQQNFPSTRPSLNLNFARSKTLDPRITFTRTSSATYVDENGLVKIAPANSPRFDHDPVTGESLGLLIEEQRENLITWSEEFIGAYWVLARATTSENSQIAPNGINDAYSLIEDLTPSNTHSIAESITFTAVTHTFSCYAKANQRSRIRLLVFDGVTSFGAYFNLLTGNIDTISSNTQASTTLLPGGWVRCSVTCTTTAGTGSAQIRLAPVTGNDVYTGDGTSGIYIWGAQLEIGSFPTSYIPTSGSTATRTADNASMTGSNFSSWYNPNEGTIFADSLVKYNPNATRFVWGLSGGSIEHSLRQPHLSGLRFRAVIGGTITPSPGTGNNAVDGTTTKSAVAYNSTTGRLQVGTSSDEVTVSGIVYATKFTIGPHNGTIKNITYYPSRLPNQILQNLTK